MAIIIPHNIVVIHDIKVQMEYKLEGWIVASDH